MPTLLHSVPLQFLHVAQAACVASSVDGATKNEFSDDDRTGGPALIKSILDRADKLVSDVLPGYQQKMALAQATLEQLKAAGVAGKADDFDDSVDLTGSGMVIMLHAFVRVGD